MTKRYTVEQIVAMINSNDEALRRAMVRLYDRQTQDEKATDTTRHTNRRGFNCCDVKKLSYYGRWCKSGRVLTGWHKQKALALVYKYRRQLTAIANGEDNRPMEQLAA